MASDHQVPSPRPIGPFLLLPGGPGPSSTGPLPVTKDTFDRYPSIEYRPQFSLRYPNLFSRPWVASNVGLDDHVDLSECRRLGITVTNASDTFSSDVANIAVALLINVLHCVSAGNRYVRAGLWSAKVAYPLASKVIELDNTNKSQ
ncbi:glyoxylate/hydroxypyruvate reductase HPR3-like [Rhododendron vialii]|uniref:glyoxylate/hydroxypyruvate reductase HPR3-like n=1 Tax=Rhododendron vialii TaxID=182163 RepID=UPI00265FD6AD|nr:glyoxylate/hydroxypyruvate reductase HPR3-like [Rhododendron vialii]